MSTISYEGGLSVSEVKSQVKAEKIHKLSSNESPLGPSAAVLSAVQEAAGSLNQYPPRKDDAFRKTLAHYHGRDLTADHFISAAGGVEVISLLTEAYLEPQHQAIICPPTFGWYVRAIERQQAEVVSVPLDTTHFGHNVDAILAAVTNKTRLVFICNPQNPTGAMLTTAEMTRLVNELPPEVIIVADEVYYHFVQRDDYPDSIGHVLNGDNVIIIHSFSKAHGLAGLRLGYGIAKPELIKPMAALKRPFHQNSLLLAAGTAALNDTAHLQKTVTLVNEGKQYLYTQLEALGIDFWPSEANFVLIRPSKNKNTTAVYNHLIQRGIMTRPTDGNGLPGYLRVSIGLPEANEAFVSALKESLDL